jgi:hypothetical protein
MTTDNPSISGGAIPIEIARCLELLAQYVALGPAGAFGATRIRGVIAFAHKAVAEGDPVGMRHAYEELKSCK